MGRTRSLGDIVSGKVGSISSYDDDDDGLDTDGVELCGGFTISNGAASLLFACMAILGVVGVNVSLPLFSNSVTGQGRAGPYFVLLYGSFWFALVFFIVLGMLRLCTNQIRPENTYKAVSHLDMFWVGFTTALNGLLIVFASPTSRTPGFTQSLLVNVSIPMTIAFRYIILKKGVNWKQALAAGIVMVGIFVALVPNLFGLGAAGGGGGGASTSESAAARILWPLCFMLGFAPGSVQTVMSEKGLKASEPLDYQTALLQHEAEEGARAMSREGAKRTSKDRSGRQSMDVEKAAADDDMSTLERLARRRKSQSRMSRASRVSSSGMALSAAMTAAGSTERTSLMYFMAWTNLYQFLCNLALFWADLIPGFGMATTKTLVSGLVFGAECAFAARPECDDGEALSRAVVFIFCFMFSAVASGLLVRQPGGANYVALVGSATTPVAALFWALFAPAPLRFDPTFHTTKLYSVAGLAIMVPGIIYYNRNTDEKTGH